MNTILNRKTFLRSAGILVLVVMSFITGCTAKGNINDGGDVGNKKIDIEEDNQKKVMSDFNILLESNPDVKTIIVFINKNISNISKENSSIMIDKFEKIQKNNLQSLEGKYYVNETIQSKIDNVYKSDPDLTKIKNIQDEELKSILIETRDSGYKVETAEGTYFPIINYEFYKKYSSHLAEDMNDYIDIMAVESNNVPAKDAALVIEWDEIITRILSQEKFIKNHENSVKVNEIEQLQKKYLTFMLYGTNNTPLFSYDSKVMVEDAKVSYLNALKSNRESEVMHTLERYMDILSKTDYKLSDEAEQFRNSIIDFSNLKI